MRPIAVLTVAVSLELAGALVGGIKAQTVEGLDIARVRARAMLAPRDAAAFAGVVARRGEALRREATASAAEARGAVRRYAANASRGSVNATFDFDAMVAANAAALAPDEAPRLLAFASLSMPAAALRRMIEDVTRAGGVVAFRGLPGNSAVAFATALARALPAGGAQASIGVDPRLFRAFGVEAVPTYVVTATDFELCDGFDCGTSLPPHDRATGNVTLGYALDRFATGDGPAARVAAAYAARLAEKRP